MAAAAQWVLDDAFWDREPATAVGDHLASGHPAASRVAVCSQAARARTLAQATRAAASAM
jgi:hypothetical protein